eukprot:jgi/Bigna1/136844/aug1.36_g11552
MASSLSYQYDRIGSSPSSSNNILVEYSYDSELSLLEGFRDHIVATDPDLITAYNSDSFDWPFLGKRFDYLRGKEYLSRFPFFSRLILHENEIQEQEFSSGAFGSSVSYRYKMPGRVGVDLYPYLKRNFKFRSYKLNEVSKELLGRQKVDLPIKDMFSHFKSRDPARLKEIHRYCLMDTLLPLDIWQSQCILESIIEMARVTYVFPKGTQKVWFEFARFCSKADTAETIVRLAIELEDPVRVEDLTDIFAHSR